ncbi:MAG: FAD-dependent oxidoreductase [Patescibacteria group bacterium]|nr:FAD-dependent oxidoreductase [Patescibacteria group bacterium]
MPTNKKIYDCVVIGGGPAALSAAIYLARQKMDFALIASQAGGQVIFSEEVGNYLGFRTISGAALIKNFTNHLTDYKIILIEGETVKRVSRNGKSFIVRTENDAYYCRTVLVATGEKYRELNVPGEKKYFGKGVTYCATCDAPLFSGKDVVVVGGGNSAMESALLLAKHARSVAILTINDALKGEKLLIERINRDRSIRVIAGAKTIGIFGDKFVRSLRYEQDGRPYDIPMQGIFVEIGLVPAADFIDFVKKNKKGEIVINKYNAASVPGIWAAGDVTDVTVKQIAVSVGEGAKAAVQIIGYIQKNG